MFDSLLASKDDAINLLKTDHDKVKDLFDQFENTENLAERKRIADEAIAELKIHAEIEEKIFYPTVREELNEDLMNEADEEHHVAKLIIAELERMSATDDHWAAKFTVLAENVRHHIKEEEGEMLPEARRLDIDFDMLGRKLLTMKKDLKENGVPVSDEEKLMRYGPADSPARAARGRTERKPAARKTGKGSYTSSARTIRKTRTAPRHGSKSA